MSMELFVAFGIIVILVALGVPIFAALGLGCAMLISYTGALPMAFFGEAMFSSLNSFVLLAIPMFILTGDLIVVSGLSTKLINLADSVFGGLNTGVGTATVAACGLFASISGSNASDAAAIGRITYDDLQKYGYSGSYSSALIASGATTGILIPPSIVYIVAGMILGISASELFKAAIIPGLLILFGVMATNIVLNRLRKYESGNEFDGIPTIGRNLWGAKLALSIPIIILGGIYSGIFTPTESAAVAVLVTLVVGLPQGRISFGEFPDIFERSAMINGMVAPLLAVAVMLGEMLTLYQIPQMIVDSLLGAVGSQFAVILIMFILFLLGGAIMETGPNIVILGPLLLPTAVEFGIDPIHFTVFMVSTLGVGFITPPFGLNLFVMSGVTGEPVSKVAKDAIPFAAVLLLISLLIGLFPGLYMWVL